MKDPRERPDDIVTLAGRGPNAPVSARRGGELARAFDDTSLTLLNVQPPADESEAGGDIEDADEVAADPTAVGEETIADVAEAAGLDVSSYEPRVEVSRDLRETLVETASEYDTICVGATGESAFAQALFGSIPRDIVDGAEGGVLMARGVERSPRTLRQALVEWLSR